ncbi:putative adenylyltransferase/sulfurtransferase MoeZ (Includes: Sulfur carrier protein CysO adenylyltransferase; Sulfur carrier protein CysO sulfurtransferase) [Paraburkholderia ribeironis]|uniref:Molybdopterin-synthase adenylyltransferase n=1 Tax=Paraburkholderia ribeironis TaxID=1247936 RepID=A0A1N7S935_9BURK|nr:molybdopterin-synthase adenylyltransferase MoeB [Paraburkholderia ribeironis]SIT43841.1 putative adenylyltransferase/sulfurtransferase MoeZ (Includes: Sulfur carrier protein CysO adenylyltransferase; Sulfur carrier protein CysO sulfurtransferase) [Paraburkholderia ribeironis]
MKTVIFPEVLARAAKLSSNRLMGYGGTVGEVISDVCKKHPALNAHLFYDNREFKEHFLLTTKGVLAEPDTPLSGDDEVEIMLATSGGTDPTGLSNEEVQRYVRQITLPHVGRQGQLRLKQAKVLVIGTGGLGSPVSLYLAAVGVGTIGLADFDLVESSNLQRQIVHGYSTLGMPKVDSARQRLLDVNPHIEVRTHQCAVNSENAQDLIGQYDLVVDGTDNFASRYLVNAVCVKQNKPLVFGAINRFDRQISVFNLNGGPCYQCLFSKNPPPELSPSCNAGGVIGVLPGVVGLLQATEAVKVVLGIGESLAGRLLRFDALRMAFDEVKFGRRSHCPACGVASTNAPSVSDDEQACQSAPVLSERLEAHRYIDPNGLHQIIVRGGEGYALLDVRDANELEVCRLPGILNIPLSDLDDRIAELDVSRRYIVVCYAGVRAERAAVRLMGAGFDKVQVLDGGMKRWARDVERDMPMY